MTLWHKHRHHFGGAAAGICPSCGADFPTDSLLAAHVAKEHPETIEAPE